MNDNLIYRIGANAADELLLPLGIIDGKKSRLYVEFVMLGIFLSEVASKTILEKKESSEDNFIATVLLYRDHFFDGDISTMAIKAKLAYHDFHKIMDCWPIYNSQSNCHRLLECLEYRLLNYYNYIIDERLQSPLKNKLIDVMKIVENVYISTSRNPPEHRFNRSEEHIKKANLEQDDTTIKIMKEMIEREHQFIRKKFPLIVLTLSITCIIGTWIYHITN